VPYVIVVGEKEVAGGDVTPRVRKDMAVADPPKTYTAAEFLGTVANEVVSRTSKTSL